MRTDQHKRDAGGPVPFSSLSSRTPPDPLDWLHRQLFCVAFFFYIAAIVLFVMFGLSGCATPGRTVGLAIGAALVAGAAHHGHDVSQPDVRTPANPCFQNPESCR